MPDVTVCIPIGLAHQPLAQRAIDSVNAQAVTCNLYAMLDEQRLGPGVLRNRMLAEVTTRFVVFLDADDWIEPTFAEETLAEYHRIGGDKYIFTDWLDMNGHIVVAPCKNNDTGPSISVPGQRPYCGGTYHAITCLVPTDWARAVQGFDETLQGLEDTDFWLKMSTTLRCGHHLARPLFHYSDQGQRAITIHQDRTNYSKIMTEFSVRYGGRMGCCGDDAHIVAPTGVRQPGDILAMALWHGNRQVVGQITGRMYPRISMPNTAWVDPADVAEAPDEWRIVQTQPVTEPQSMTSVAQIAHNMLQTARQTTPNPYVATAGEPPAPEVTTKPDVSRVVRLGQAAMKSTSDPVFVFPIKQYPSYSDIRRLVELSGFEITDPEHIDAFSKRPYIVVSPEYIGDLNGLKARVICWQLEYAGDYTENYKDFTGEVWASDKAWADANGAKYVLMGSHEELSTRNQHWTSGERRFDVTMLGYMTPRRQSIKEKLSGFLWSDDYPGHDPRGPRHDLLDATHLMLHVHQHDHAAYCAPQRVAIAAAYHMRMLSETVADPGALEGYVTYADYDKLVPAVKRELKKTANTDKLHDYLCHDRTFRVCVEEALK